MTDRAAIARESMRAALQLRRSLAIAREWPVNPFDVAHAVGIEVWFVDAPSLEGMFARTDVGRIILPSLNHRPLGRLCFSCAHELGHSQLGHGNRVDEYVGSKRPPKSHEEIAADVFASSLLMPRPAVVNGLRIRKAVAESASPALVLAVAFEMSVGYETLVKHMHWGLDLVGRTAMENLLKSTPKSIRLETFGEVPSRVVVPIDAHYRASSIDLEVGDAVAVPSSTVTQSLESHFEFAVRADDWMVHSATRPGIVHIEHFGKRIALRVARKGFVGPWRYRYLEDSQGP